MQLIGTATILLALYKMYLFYRAMNNSWANKLVHAVMILNICAALARMIKWVDPISTRRVWRWGDTSFWATTSYPFTIASMLLLSFYWMQQIEMRGGGEVRLFLTSRWKYLAYSIIAVVFALEMATAIMRLILFEDPIFAILTGMGAFLITMIVAGYFLYSAVKIIRVFKNSGSSGKTNTRRISYLIIGCACVMIITAVVSLGIATPWFDQPVGYTTLINLWYPIFSLVNLTQVSRAPPIAGEKKALPTDEILPRFWSSCLRKERPFPTARARKTRSTSKRRRRRGTPTKRKKKKKKTAIVEVEAKVNNNGGE